MSVINEERNELLKRFKNKAVIVIDDTLYSSRQLLPTYRNKRLFPVHDEAVARLNQTMQRHIDGNAQIWNTMIYKDVPRENLIVEFWNGLIATPEFKSLPQRLKDLELEQAKKIGPTSRFTIEKLFDGFIKHIDEEAKTRNTHIDEYREAAEYFADYIIDTCKEAMRRDPSLRKYITASATGPTLLHSLPADKAGGDPYFIRTDRNISGTIANELYFRDYLKVKSNVKSVYYTMYSRVQNKGNNIIKGIEPAKINSGEDPWLPEKNRVVQGDSRSWQFMLKRMSDVITKIPKTIDPIFVGWCDQERKNLVMEKTMKAMRGSVLFDSFDATEYDATTDPENFALGIHIIFKVCRKLGVRNLPDEHQTLDHYLHDPTLTPWGAYLRDSTPSGHNFTGPNGTLTNMLRCYVQERRRRNCSFEELNNILKDNWNKDIALFSCVGDDAFQMRDLNATADKVSEENNLDGFSYSDLKALLEADNIHYLQFDYYLDDTQAVMGYYPISRVMEHALFQERPNQYTAESVAVQACVQNLNNARYNPCQSYGIEFLMKGDPKYRLGFKGGVMNLFKAASGGSTVSEFLDREWDPAYQNMSWEQYSETIRDTVQKIEAIGRKAGY